MSKNHGGCCLIYSFDGRFFVSQKPICNLDVNITSHSFPPTSHLGQDKLRGSHRGQDQLPRKEASKDNGRGPRCTTGQKTITLQGINISHLGKRKIIFKMPFLGDMLVPWRVFIDVCFFEIKVAWVMPNNLPFGSIWHIDTRVTSPQEMCSVLQNLPRCRKLDCSYFAGTISRAWFVIHTETIIRFLLF